MAENPDSHDHVLPERSTTKGMWIDNTRNAKIKGDQIEVFKL